MIGVVIKNTFISKELYTTVSLCKEAEEATDTLVKFTSVVVSVRGVCLSPYTHTLIVNVPDSWIFVCY